MKVKRRKLKRNLLTEDYLEDTMPSHMKSMMRVMKILITMMKATMIELSLLVRTILKSYCVILLKSIPNSQAPFFTKLQLTVLGKYFHF